MLTRFRMVAVLASLALVPCLSGCAEITGLLNPEFLAALGVGPRVASLPGDAPALLLEVENATERVVDVMVSYRGADDEVELLTFQIEPFEKTAQALICPVEEVTVGQLSNLNEVGVRVRLGAGGLSDPFVEVEPFGIVLQEGLNYECGDAVTFSVQRSAKTLSGYQIFAYIRSAEGGG